MRFLLVIVGCLSFAGCKDATKDFEGLAERACACAADDVACGNKVLADLVTFTDHAKMSDGNQAKITAAGVKISGCLSSSGVQEKQVTAALEKMVK
jgi:hypothetical protein